MKTPLRQFLLLFVMWCVSARAEVDPLQFPPAFRTQMIDTNGTRIHVRVGGKGPAVVLLHGYGETGDVWAPMAADLMRDRTVVVPDLRGLGLSAKPADGFDKYKQSDDVAGVLDALQIKQAEVVAHDIGNMVAFAFSARYPQRVSKLVVIDAPVPGIGPWDEILKQPMLWHFRFGGPDMERLVSGRERIYLDRFWNEFSATPNRFTEAARAHYAKLYARPGAMHSGFAQFAAFDRDAADNRTWLANGGRLNMPILALGGEKSFGSMMATVMRAAASDVREGIVPDSGHWIMEENPTATTQLVRTFLDYKIQARLTPNEIGAMSHSGASTGTSGVAGIQTRVLKGDPTKPGLYTIQLTVPANTTIKAHTHADDRIATVVSGTWYFGYGTAFEPKALKALSAGSFYAEPPEAHFARTGDTPVVLHITGVGPTSTHYVE
ncbi:MAG TPA: alpha/beta fold hydrolase [Steroidobacter sp.]